MHLLHFTTSHLHNTSSIHFIHHPHSHIHMSDPYSIIKPIGFTVASCGYCGSENSARVYGAFAFKLTCQVEEQSQTNTRPGASQGTL